MYKETTSIRGLIGHINSVMECEDWSVSVKRYDWWSTWMLDKTLDGKDVWCLELADSYDSQKIQLIDKDTFEQFGSDKLPAEIIPVESVEFIELTDYLKVYKVIFKLDGKRQKAQVVIYDNTSADPDDIYEYDI